MREKIVICLRLLQEVLNEIDGVVPEFPSSAKKLLDDGVCLNCKLPIGKEKAYRGCHQRCYHRIWREISNGKITESIAIESGLLAPQIAAGRKKIESDRLNEVIRTVKDQDAKAVAKYAKKNKKESRPPEEPRP